jgi:predicted DNA-binding transcriptional regulator AlpA
MTPRLVGVREISKLLSLSRQRADQLVRTKGFPDPVRELASGRIWERAAVVSWAREAGRSIPWATVELELEQLPTGAPMSPANMYRDVWEITRMRALGRQPRGVSDSLEYAHELALTAAREVDSLFDRPVPAKVDPEQ